MNVQSLFLVSLAALASSEASCLSSGLEQSSKQTAPAVTAAMECNVTPQNPAINAAPTEKPFITFPPQPTLRARLLSATKTGALMAAFAAVAIPVGFTAIRTCQLTEALEKKKKAENAQQSGQVTITMEERKAAFLTAVREFKGLAAEDFAKVVVAVEGHWEALTTTVKGAATSVQSKLEELKNAGPRN